LSLVVTKESYEIALLIPARIRYRVNSDWNPYIYQIIGRCHWWILAYARMTGRVSSLYNEIATSFCEGLAMTNRENIASIAYFIIEWNTLRFT
jgi:hypothetical protein